MIGLVGRQPALQLGPQLFRPVESDQELLLEMLAVMDVLDADQADEARVLFVMIEGRLDQAA